ncbi:hypothetical protein BJF79_42830 [Actinomadura sp. CNU-125]|nr:hypothetical protein BJF79_42830 [Actinomadura sp. CNU-125]
MTNPATGRSTAASAIAAADVTTATSAGIAQRTIRSWTASASEVIRAADTPDRDVPRPPGSCGISARNNRCRNSASARNAASCETSRSR